MKLTDQHNRRSNFLTLVALTALAAFAAAPAHAATDAEEAEALIREGVKLRAQDAAARALPLFEKAYQISRTPRTAAQLGLCELELGYFVEAERYLTEALASPEHPWVAKNKATLKKPLETARANVGELEVTVSPPTAEVSLNHKPIDKALLAAPIRLTRGIVDVEVRAPGYQTTTETVIVTGGKREQRAYTLVREVPPAVATVPAPAPVPTEAGAAVTLGAGPTAVGDEHKTKRIAAWITGGAAFGALVFGTVEAISASSRSSAFNDHTAVGGSGTYHDCGTNNLSPACKALKDDYDQALTFTIVGFAAAGALAATSAVLFVLSSPSGGEVGGGGARAFGCAPDLGARGVGCSLRF